MSLAKCYANEMAKRVTDLAMQLHGGNGYTEEYGIERLHRDAHGWAIAGGTPAIQRSGSPREIFGRSFDQRPPRGSGMTAPAFELPRSLSGPAGRGPGTRHLGGRHRRPGRMRPTAFDPEMRQRLIAGGLAPVVVPGEYGGRVERVDSLAVTVIREALAAESSNLDSLFAMQGIGSFALATAGTDAVRKRWLPAVAVDGDRRAWH